MRRNFVLGALAALVALVAPAAADAASKCKFRKVAELPVQMEGLRPLVPVKINGHEAQLVLDTGAFYSMLTEPAAKQMDVRGVARPGLQLNGIGGSTTVGVGLARQFTLAGADIRNVEFIVGGRDFGAGSAGLLGQNVLAFFDVEYDLANGVIRLFKPDDCRDIGLSYWAKPGEASVMRIDPITPGQPHITGKALVDGRALDVLFDTGSPTSLLTLKAAQAAGMKLDAPGVTAAGITSGIGGRAVETWLAPFGSFAIGQEEIRNTRLRVGRYELALADMLIGADFFLSHRILVSNSQRRLYFTYNGGPVFRMDRPASHVAAGSPAAGPATPASGSDGPTDANGFSLRGKASTSRRDFEAAIADFTRAIELEPKEARHYRDRATARLMARQPVLAIADLDEALKLKADDPQTLVMRGDIFLGTRDPKRALADYQAAARLAPDDINIPLRAASGLTHVGQYEPAIAMLDVWLDGHSRLPEAARAYNSRCYTRALSGKQLDRALADCDTAVQRSPRNSAVLDSRGLARLRTGDMKGALADYQAALKLQPKAAWPLYGRGVVKIRSGDAAGGAADIRAAEALDPSIPGQVKLHHLGPQEIVAAAS